MGMCGGGSNAAAQQAAINDNNQQRQIAATSGKINSIFDSPARQQQYTDLAHNTTNYYKQQLDQQHADAARNLKFALARGGQAGGSVQADQGLVLGRDYTKGLLDAQRRGISAADALRNSDQQSRAQLLNEASGGMNMGTAATEANQALQTGLASARDNSTVNQAGDLFSNLGNYYSTALTNANNRRAYTQGFNLYQPMSAGIRG